MMMMGRNGGGGGGGRGDEYQEAFADNRILYFIKILTIIYYWISCNFFSHEKPDLGTAMDPHPMLGPGQMNSPNVNNHALISIELT